MTEPIRVHFTIQDRTVEAAIGDSILELAEQNEIDLDHACGGVCACSTCHIKIVSGGECFSEAAEDEEDQLDNARDVDLTSRLGCQARIERAPDAGAIEVAIPAWNVNLVQEGH
jgi:2Fe-2S ferredoxin